MGLSYSELLEVLHPKEIERQEGNDSTFPISHRAKIYRFTGSIHTKSRAKLRHPELKEEDWKDFHNKVENHLNTIPKHEKHSGEYLFYSKSKDFGYVAHVNHNDRRVHVISDLPKKRANPQPGTSKVLVEIFLQ